MTAQIHFSVAGEGPPVILMHGLFGEGSNLGALSRALRNRFRVYSLDLPNHGKSAWLDEAGPAALARGVRHWMSKQELGPVSLVGHSLGGKVAMELALKEPQSVTALVVADIAPVSYPPHHNAVFAALDAVVEADCESREQAAGLMEAHLRERDVIQFLLKSLKKSGEGAYRWRFNLQGIKRHYSEVLAAPGTRAVFEGPVLFVKGGESDYILPEHRPQVASLFPDASVKVMPGCGHWLHAQRPSLFNSIVGRFLDAQLALR